MYLRTQIQISSTALKKIQTYSANPSTTMFFAFRRNGLGRTALQMAVARGHREVASTLRRFGAEDERAAAAGNQDEEGGVETTFKKFIFASENVLDDEEAEVKGSSVSSFLGKIQVCQIYQPKPEYTGLNGH
jgi:ankyrin repeat protein